jgi:hypothetical protein
VISVQAIVLPSNLANPKEAQPAEITQLLFQSASKLDFAHFRAPVSDGGPKDRRFRDDAHGLLDR